MNNPFQSPTNPEYRDQHLASARGPGIALIVVAAICLIASLLALMVDVWLISSGALEQLEARNTSPVPKSMSISIRIIWTSTLMLTSAYIIYGGIQMVSGTRYQAARTACILAVIPCIGPCYILGIPFGIWGLVVLGRPEVRESFR